MKVARVTVRAMTQGLMTGRDFGLAGESSFGVDGGATAGAVAAAGGSKTAWVATVTVPFLCLNGQMLETMSQIYI
jgi:hypothetical protein